MACVRQHTQEVCELHRHVHSLPAARHEHGRRSKSSHMCTFVFHVRAIWVCGSNVLDCLRRTGGPSFYFWTSASVGREQSYCGVCEAPAFPLRPGDHVPLHKVRYISLHTLAPLGQLRPVAHLKHCSRSRWCCTSQASRHRIQSSVHTWRSLEPSSSLAVLGTCARPLAACWPLACRGTGIDALSQNFHGMLRGFDSVCEYVCVFAHHRLRLGA